VKEAISLQLQGGGQAAVGDVGEGNPRAIWRSLMRIRSAIGDDDPVTTTFAQCERALSTAGTAQQQPPAHYWTSCAVYPFRLIHAVAGRVHVRSTTTPATTSWHICRASPNPLQRSHATRYVRDLHRPVIYSHSCMRATWDHPRNISDDQARACAAPGGVIGITGVGIFLGPNSPTLEAMTRHLEYAVDDVGRVGLDRVDRRRAHPRMPRPFANALVLDRLVIEQRCEEAYQAGPAEHESDARPCQEVCSG
jgi:hypothetical protein